MSFESKPSSNNEAFEFLGGETESSTGLHGFAWLGDALLHYAKRFLGVVCVVLVPPRFRTYVMGDSHCQIFRQRIGVMRTRLGPITLHRAGRPGEAERLYKEAFFWPRRLRFLPFPKPSRPATIVLSFGEIDFRAHVARQVIRQDVGPEIIVAGLVDSAVSLVERVSQLSDSKIIFLAVLPPTDQYFDEEYPTAGSLLDRVQWVQSFNAQLGETLVKHHQLRARVLDITARFAKQDGSLDPKFSDGMFHYGDLVRDEIRSAARDLSSSIL